ncbi:hypothetical protein Tcan_05011 [Toxocara canis]|uniref:Uncharacterized protein n=2 Tax=Toxocara canis TaxID=6265 RepID=A0A0B2VL60_TOXCA|nr:hypothetical protein Tcan_05007 [Toxocara canis]KHN82134.1 hypothetical protein Tcan_05011 [Toxocara canis]VDM37479.1 unnamed protein product [Toxocara canis]
MHALSRKVLPNALTPEVNEWGVNQNSIFAHVARTSALLRNLVHMVYCVRVHAAAQETIWCKVQPPSNVDAFNQTAAKEKSEDDGTPCSACVNRQRTQNECAAHRNVRAGVMRRAQ